MPIEDMDADTSALYHLILDAGLADEAQLEEIWEEHERNGTPFREALFNFEVVEEDQLMWMMAQTLNTEYIDVSEVSPSPELIEQFQNLLRGSRTIDKLSEAFEIVRSHPHGHVRAVLGTLQRVKLHTVILQRSNRHRELVQAMVVARILSPTSKLATARGLDPKTCSTTLAQELNLGMVTEVKLYQAMDWLLKRQSKIEQKLAQKHLSEETMVLCDLSSSYLEGEQCSLGKRGHCRDRKKGKVQIEFSLLCNQQGCPVAVTVFEGNTSDSQTLKPQLEKLTERFGIKHGIFVGDRGTLPDTQISKQLKDLEGWDWITALRAAQIRKLLDEGTLKLEKLATRSWIEIQSPTYPHERLIACRNRHLANQTKHKREELLQATETELDKIVVATRRSKQRLEGEAEIGLRVGKVLNRFKVAKHFELSITDTHFSYQRQAHSIEADARLDGLYVIAFGPQPDAQEAQESRIVVDEQDFALALLLSRDHRRRLCPFAGGGKGAVHGDRLVGAIPARE